MSPTDASKALREVISALRRVAARRSVATREEADLRDAAALLENIAIELIQPAGVGGQYPSNGVPAFTWVKSGERFHVRVVLPSYKPCEKCGGPQCAMFDAGLGGYSAGTEYKHDAACPALRCEHGVLWKEDCAECEENERLAREQCEAEGNDE
jgi:hypothetical protein